MGKMISIVTPCYNEEENISEVITQVRNVMSGLDYTYEHILVDNRSTDATWEKIKSESEKDSHVKGIRNVRNFGPLRNAMYGLFQASGDAAISLAADLQDPPELIPTLIAEWEKGYKVVLGQKDMAEESKFMMGLRSLYYGIIAHFSDTKQYKQTTGWGLYDASVIKVMKQLNEPEPSLRHIVAELGYEASLVKYCQPKRQHGKSSYNFKSYIEYAFQTLISTSQAPLKLAVVWGFTISFVSFVLGIVYLIWKLTDWWRFDTGQAPMLIGLFFIGGVLLMFIGIIGEYIGEIFKRTRNFPLVIEQERVGFDEDEGRS
ncbi:MAG: glycosyltransferase family 2 protein [Lachnospiraceae bacterium]|nr:glycosyltransferase family 2 protein [Lachnospiraceae bacterium]